MPLLWLVLYPPGAGEPAGNRVEASHFRQGVPVTVLRLAAPGARCRPPSLSKPQRGTCGARTSGYARAAEDANTKLAFITIMRVRARLVAASRPHAVVSTRHARLTHRVRGTLARPWKPGFRAHGGAPLGSQMGSHHRLTSGDFGRTEAVDSRDLAGMKPQSAMLGHA